MTTIYSTEKKAAKVKGTVNVAEGLPNRLAGLPVEGYEIQTGVTRPIPGSMNRPFLQVAAGEPFREEWTDHPGWPSLGNGSHGIFDNDQFRREWLNDISSREGMATGGRGDPVSKGAGSCYGSAGGSCPNPYRYGPAVPGAGLDRRSLLMSRG